MDFKNKSIITIICLVMISLIGQNSFGQLVLSSPNTSGTYSAPSSITLAPGFSSAGTFYAFINPDCATLNYTLSTNQNYVATYSPRQSGIANPTSTTNSTCQVMQTVQYFDGLGRPLQTIQTKGSPLTNDLVQPYSYDQLGRESIQYKSYAAAAGGNGSYHADAITPGAGVWSFYNPSGTPTAQTQLPGGLAHINTPFASTVFESSPANRVTEQGDVGDSWQPNATNPDLSHTTRISHDANDLTDITNIGGTFKVMLYKAAIAADGSRTLTNAGTTAYQAGQLYVTTTKDENWQASDQRAGTVQVFKDKAGRIVLKRLFNRTPDNTVEMLSTYYVYDDLDMLCYVLTPGASPDAGTVNQAALDNLCYQYRYDDRNRMIERKLPGKGKELMVYNSLDQLVMTQDANQRNQANQQWKVTKYDVLGRVVVTGFYTHAGSTANTDYRSSMQTSVNSSTSTWEPRVNSGNGYNTAAGLYVAYPTTLNTTLNINYYDDYNIPGLPSVYDKHLESGMSIMTKGLQTASLVKVLDGTTGNSNMLWEVNYYDDLGRLIRNFSQHFKGGVLSVNNYDETTNTFDFTNVLLTSSRKNNIANGSAASLSVTVNTSYDYDHMGRKIRTWEEINGNKILLSKSDYNEIGQLIDKKIHSTDQGQSFVQSIDYRYNSRGWLKSINNASLTNDGLINNDTNDAFGMELSYDDYGTAALRQYNGNISAISWQSKVPSASAVSQVVQGYEYSYDRINRLTKANYTTPGLVGQYNEVLSYDAIGNIKTLSRFKGNATTPIDQLMYTYGNNNLSSTIVSVADNTNNDLGQLGGTTSYSNDLNGNLLSDSRKQLSYTYNHLNLPLTVTKTGVGAITYIYDAAGRKLRKVLSGANRDYVDGVEYDNSGAIAFVNTEEGRARPSGSSYFYEYTLKDHLGNTRVMIGQDGVVGQQTDYYAFGMELNRGIGVTPSPDNKYKYNNKEFQDELGMNVYDYGARLYDPAIARWTTMDPMAEFMRRHSPYNYAMNNPMRFTDPTGMAAADTTVNLGTLKVNVNIVSTPTSSFAKKAGNFLLGAIDYIPFGGSVKQIGVGIYHGDWKEAGLGVVFLAVDFATAGEGGEALKLAEKGAELVAEDVIKVGAEDEVKEVAEKKLVIEVAEENKIDRDLLDPPNKPGDSPTFKSDGKSAEIHHDGQKAEGPFKEMHPDDHRGAGNYRTNHPAGQKPLTAQERKEFNSARRAYWKKEYFSKK